MPYTGLISNALRRGYASSPRPLTNTLRNKPAESKPKTPPTKAHIIPTSNIAPVKTPVTRPNR